MTGVLLRLADYRRATPARMRVGDLVVDRQTGRCGVICASRMEDGPLLEAFTVLFPGERRRAYAPEDLQPAGMA